MLRKPPAVWAVAGAVILWALLPGPLAAQKQEGSSPAGEAGPLQKITYAYFLDRTGVHTGNLIRTAYSNFGNLGSRTLVEARLEWPVGSGVLYGFEFAFFAASEVSNDTGAIIHIVSERYSGTGRDVPTPETRNWGWEPLPGYFNDGIVTSGLDEDLNGNGILDAGEDLNRNGKLDSQLINLLEYPAMSHLPQTWPYDWPEGSHPGLAGARRNRWNGEYGAFVRADQESYYVMDDRSNDEFAYYPDSTDTRSFLEGGRRGVGLEVEVRNYQWANPLAEDILISIYQVRNTSNRPLPKNIIGMYVDADLGRGDADDDASDFDAFDDITYQWDIDFLDRQGRPIGYFGFAFLQSPGLIDGIDNDLDGMIDESQEDGIDNDGDWVPYSDLNGNGSWDYEDVNLNGIFDDGEDANGNGVLDIEPLNDDVGSDGLGPDDQDYSGPDGDGSQGNGLPNLGEPNFEFTDNDEIDQIGLTSYYASEPSHDMGADEDFWQTKIQPGEFTNPISGTDVAFTYGTGFFDLPPGFSERFAIASIFGNDFPDILRNKRTMQRIYDADYDFTRPPVNSTLRAVAGDRKVYLTWDTQGEKSKDPIYGHDFAMYKIYRSTDPFFNDIKVITDAFGNPVLWEPLVQFDLIDGLTGAHPVSLRDLGVSYDMGNDSGLRHSYVDTTVDNGRTYFYALVGVDKGYDTDFFERGLVEKPDLPPISPTESSKIVEVDFLGTVISLGRNVVQITPSGPAGGVSSPIVSSLIAHVEGPATGSIAIEITVPDSIRAADYQIVFSDTTLERLTTDFLLVNLTSGDTLLSRDADFDHPELEKAISEGFKVSFDNHAEPKINTVRWLGSSNLIVRTDITSVGMPVDFEIEFFDEYADTSFSPVPTLKMPVYFKIRNLTEPGFIDFFFEDNPENPDSTIGVGDVLTLIAELSGKNAVSSWKLEFDIAIGDSAIVPQPGEKLRVTTLKPFSASDVYEFSTQGWMTATENKLDAMANIYVVPDPYVAVNPLEPRQSSALVGRGERRVEFVNLPEQCTIRIYSVSGKLVRVLKHNTSFDKGREAWDLLSKDGLEVAFGIYFFHVDAEGVGEKVGRFAIIK
ncbi:MAG: hypothetical protein IIA59_02035 [Candidatus Marinimicrobia bacterium]|nr:hypothetical protein [Candidatus Neomarinimicrobiota bacterium]